MATASAPGLAQALDRRRPVAHRGAVLAPFVIERSCCTPTAASKVQGQRRAGVGVAGEADQADGIVRAAGGEVAEHPLDHLEPVLLLPLVGQVERRHRAGDVDHHADGDPLGADAALLVGRARPGQGQGEQRRGQRQAQVGQPGHAGAQAVAGRRQRAQRRVDHPAAGAAGQQPHRTAISTASRSQGSRHSMSVKKLMLRPAPRGRPGRGAASASG
jgi:hypothetical protein